METVKIDPIKPDPVVTAGAAETLRRGGVIIYPTETAYGLGASALNGKALEKVFRIKGRDFRKPLSVMVAGIKMAAGYVELNPHAEKVFAKLLPGPLTVVLKKKACIPDRLTGGSPNLGLRVSPVPLLRLLICSFGQPFTATSANISGAEPLYDPKELSWSFSKEALAMVDLVLDAGPLTRQATSTVLDLTVSPPRILRSGPVTWEEIQAVLCLN